MFILKYLEPQNQFFAHFVYPQYCKPPNKLSLRNCTEQAKSVLKCLGRSKYSRKNKNELLDKNEMKHHK